ncbi:hypothetical protein [Mycobacterium uberis]
MRRESLLVPQPLGPQPGICADLDEQLPGRLDPWAGGKLGLGATS